MKPTLVILAAGMASRYGSMKQVEGFGPSGETIMDYSIYDAIRAGFGKVVFIIRKEFEKNFGRLLEKILKAGLQRNMFSRKWISFPKAFRFLLKEQSPGVLPMLFFVPKKK